MTRRLLLPIAFTLALSACGFHLRNSLTLPPDAGTVKVVTPDPYSPLALTLVKSIERAGGDAVVAVDAPKDVQMAELKILSERWADTPVALDQLGRAQEIMLRYAVIFEVLRPDGSTLVPQQPVELAREYISVPTNSTGTAGERELLVKEMQRDMTASILRRIDVTVRAQLNAGNSLNTAPAGQSVPADQPTQETPEDN